MAEWSIHIVKTSITRQELAALALNFSGEMVKAVVDIEKRQMAVGGQLHADEEAVLLEQGSRQDALWGINLFPHKEDTDMVEFDSVINIRPAQHNRSRSVEDPATRAAILAIIKMLVI